jgi:MOSC domain-containing protein YiiM
VATTRGRIRAISISERKGISKSNVPDADLRVDHGVVGDAHAGSGPRQVSLLAGEAIDRLRAKGTNVAPGAFGENLTVDNMDLSLLRVGTTLRIGAGAALEVTQLGKQCHGRCAIYEQVGDCIMPRDGIFARVTNSGQIRVGDDIEAVDD